MRNIKIFVTAALASVILCGCSIDAGDNLFAPPKLSGDYLALQNQIDQIKKDGAIPEYPAGGSNRDSVQLIDIDGDGIEEAVAFFKNGVGSQTFSVYVYKNESGTYNLAGSISGQGNGISSVYYPQCRSNGALAVVVCWDTGEEITDRLSIGMLDENGNFADKLSADFGEIYISNLSDDGTESIFTICQDTDSAQLSAYAYIFSDFSVRQLIPSPLSAGLRGIAHIKGGQTSDGENAVFIDGIAAGKGFVTDVIVRRGENLENITLDKTSGISTKTYRSISLPSASMTSDAILSVPLAYTMPGYLETSPSIQWLIEWNSVDSAGNLLPILKTYHCVSEEWYFIWSEKWEDKVTVLRDSALSDGKTTFCAVSRGKNIPLFSIYAASAEADIDFALSSEYIVIGANSTTNYYLRFEDEGKGNSLLPSEEEIRTDFHIIPKVWTAEVYG